MGWTVLLALVAVAAPLPSAAAPSNTALAEEAVESYMRALNTESRNLRLEEFRRSERLFSRVAESGAGTADLYTNLGNAALQAEHLGRAVLAYRRALRLDPDHSRALQNLAHARSLLPRWIPRRESGGLLDTFFLWHRTLSRVERARAAALCFALMAILVAAAIRFGQPSARNAALLPGLAWLALVASLLLDPMTRSSDEAVVTAPEVAARAADSALAPSPFPAPLRGGVEVRILEERTPWVRIRLANGRDAWVVASSLTRVAPPE